MRTAIRYEDQHVIVAYKPAGLAVQTANVAQTDMVSELKTYRKGGYLGVVHRLDQPVEGLLVFGATKSATAALAKQLADGTLRKRYYAAVCGKPDASQGELVDYLRKTPDNRAEIMPGERMREAAGKTAEADGFKRAVLRYRVLEECGELSLLEIVIDTGRFHQIRAQLSHAGTPILGDVKYGTEHSARLSAAHQVRSVALCACDLEFLHPETGGKLTFHAAPKGDIFQCFNHLKYIAHGGADNPCD